ncbi:MAG TPA: helix-turn-helix domain-containing protein [Marmoricola sp.]|nr:helix-turn-helix domain-containing protein [Marmoricola sp.]
MTTTWRARQAELTKERIVDAARRLIAGHGYAATSIDAIAREAGVAVPTVYKAFGTKRAIALALNARIDAEAGMPELVPRVLAAESGRDVVEGSVRIGRALFERSGDLIAMVDQVAPSEPELAAVRDEGNRRLVEGTRAAVVRLDELGELRAGLSTQQAAGLLAQLSSAEAFLSLTRDHGWTPDQCEQWLTDAACRLLLDPDNRR